MSDFRIITDSIADLPREWLLKHPEVIIIPTPVIADGKEFEDLSPEGLDAILRSSESVSTSSPNLSLVEKTIRSVLEEGKNALYIAMASSLSSTYQHITMICNEINDDGDYSCRAVCVDSECMTVGMAMVIQRALECDDFYEAIGFVKFYGPGVGHIVGVTSFDQLHKSGRIHGIGKFVANVLGIKPVLKLVTEDGERIASAVGIARSERQLVPKIIQLMREDIGHSSRVVIAYGIELNMEAKRLADAIRKEFPDAIVEEGWRLGSALGCHVGPRSFGVFYDTDLIN